MQPARFKLNAEERTCNPVQRPNCSGHALTMAEEAKVGRNRKHHLSPVGRSAAARILRHSHPNYTQSARPGMEEQEN